MIDLAAVIPPPDEVTARRLLALLNPRTIEDFEKTRLREVADLMKTCNLTKREAELNLDAMEEARRLNLGDIDTDDDPVIPDAEPRDEATPATKPCALYRHFDAEHNLLYVGISVDPDIRRNQHRYQSGWFRFAKSMTVEWFDTTAIAHRAERHAIHDETPIFNKAHAGDGRASRAVAYLVDHEASDLLRPAI